MSAIGRDLCRYIPAEELGLPQDIWKELISLAADLESGRLKHVDLNYDTLIPPGDWFNVGNLDYRRQGSKSSQGRMALRHRCLHRRLAGTEADGVRSQTARREHPHDPCGRKARRPIPPPGRRPRAQVERNHACASSEGNQGLPDDRHRRLGANRDGRSILRQLNSQGNVRARLRVISG